MSHMIRKPGISGWKFIIYARSYVVSNKKHPLLAEKLTQMKMVTTGQGPEHPLMNPSIYLHIWKEMSGIVGRKLKVRRLGAWVMTQWVRRFVKFLNHRSYVELIGLNSLIDLHNQPLLFMMEGPTLWSMSVISTRGWLCIPRTKLWCARFFPSV